MAVFLSNNNGRQTWATLFVLLLGFAAVVNAAEHQHRQQGGFIRKLLDRPEFIDQPIHSSPERRASCGGKDMDDVPPGVDTGCPYWEPETTNMEEVGDDMKEMGDEMGDIMEGPMDETGAAMDSPGSAGAELETPMSGPTLRTIVKANMTGPNMTLITRNVTNFTDPLGLVQNVTDEIFDIAEAFEMKLMETPMYKEAYEKYKTPLNISDMADGLRELVEECSSNVTGGDFCDICVRPIARLEITSYYKFMRQDDIPEDLMEPAMHAVYDRAGEQLMEFMEGEGVPMDDFFYANVIYCTLHKSDPMCKIPTEKLEEDMEPILKECAKVEAAMVQTSADPEGVAVMSNTTGNATMANKEIKQYCTGCYWPFVTYMLNEALSDDFWCENRHLLHDKEAKEQTVSNETSLVDLLHTDASFISCMENARGMFFEKKVDPFDPELTRSIRDSCWEEGFFPEEAMLTPESKTYIDALECPEPDAEPEAEPESEPEAEPEDDEDEMEDEDEPEEEPEDEPEDEPEP